MNNGNVSQKRLSIIWVTPHHLFSCFRLRFGKVLKCILKREESAVPASLASNTVEGSVSGAVSIQGSRRIPFHEGTASVGRIFVGLEETRCDAISFNECSKLPNTPIIVKWSLLAKACVWATCWHAQSLSLKKKDRPASLQPQIWPRFSAPQNYFSNARMFC